MSIKAKLEDNLLKIEIPFKDEGFSKSGKTRIVATSHGLFTTEITYRGMPVILVLSAFTFLGSQKKNFREKKTGASVKRNSREKAEVTE
jgi:hypothetical protein